MSWFPADTRWIYTGLVGLVAVERVVELWISNRNGRRLMRRGAVEAGRGHYRWMVAVHTAFLVACPLEVWVLDRSWVPGLALPMVALLAGTMALRYWVVATLGERWNTRVIHIPGAPLVDRGPYRWLRHPNYLAVVLEMLALPLIHTAWLTALVFGALNAAVLAARIRVEDAALRGAGPERAPVTGARTTDGGEILQGIRDVARRHLDWNGEIHGDQRLVEALKLDSLRLLTLVVEIENHFRIMLDEGSEAGVETVSDLVALIRSKLEQQGTNAG